VKEEGKKSRPVANQRQCANGSIHKKSQASGSKRISKKRKEEENLAGGEVSLLEESVQRKVLRAEGHLQDEKTKKKESDNDTRALGERN